MSRRLISPSVLQGAPSFYWNAASLQLPVGATFTSNGGNRRAFDKNGLSQIFATDVPRFSYSGLGVTGNFDGLLMESTITNLALWNRDFTNATWVKTTMTAALDQTGIDGVSNSASSLTSTAGNAMALQVFTLTSSSRTASFYLKRITGSGTVQITTDNGTTWVDTTLSSAWQRFQVTQTVLNPVIGVRIVTSGDAVAVDMAQLQATEVATAPIATTSATVSTANDALSLPITGLINPSACTVIVRYVPYYTSSLAASARPIVSISDGTTSNRVSTLIATGGTLPTGRISSGGSSILSSVAADGTVVAGQENVVLVAQSGGANAAGGGGGAYVVSNGGTVKAQTGGANPVGLSTMYFGATDAGANGTLFGCIKEVTIYPFNIDGEMAAKLTTPRL